MSRSTIKKVVARQLLDCKCRPMLEVEVHTEGGTVGVGSAPTGSSVGKHESVVLSDNDLEHYHGMTVYRAVQMVNEVIGPAIIGMEVTDQRAIDTCMIELDGTDNKKILGGNSIYSVSLACLRAAALTCGQPLYVYINGQTPKKLPIPTFNVINGGRYGRLVQPFNEFLLVPYGAESMEEAVEIGVRVFQELETTICHYQNGGMPLLGGSFGYAAPSEDPERVLELMQAAAEACGCGGRIVYALDCASSEMYDRNTETYLLNGRRVTNEELIDYVKRLSRKFPFLFVEDLLDQDDWTGYVKAHKELENTYLIGDDLIVTNRKRLEKACSLNAVDGFILKPNQVGTITEAMDTYRYGKEKKLIAIPSGRSGGVIGDVVMDFSVGLQAPIQKNGAPRSGERIDKLNYLLRVASRYPDAEITSGREIARF